MCRRLAARLPDMMRGDERDQDGVFSHVSVGQRVPQDHPLRVVLKVDGLKKVEYVEPRVRWLYADSGRPLIAPEYRLRALLLQVFYLVRSERVAGRADRSQPAVPLVCGPWHGRHRMEPCGVLEEPRLVADFRCIPSGSLPR